MMVFYLFILTSIGYVLTNLFAPSLPVLAKMLHVDASVIQLTISLYIFGYAISPLIFGPLSDRLGRKKVIMMGLVIGIAGTLLCIVLPNITMLIIGRIIQGVGMGAIAICGRSMIADLYTGEEVAKQFSYQTLLFPLAISVAPILGSIIEESFGWHAVFIFALCYLLFIVFMMRWVPESLPVAKRENDIGNPIKRYIRLILHNKKFILYTLITALYFMSMFAYFNASPFLFQVLMHLNPVEFGRLSIFIAVALVLSGLINVKLLGHIGIHKLIHFGCIIHFLSGALILVFEYVGWNNYMALLLPVSLFFFGISFSVVNSISGAISTIKEDFGLANALLLVIQLLAGAIGAVILGFSPLSTVTPLALCLMINGFLSASILFFIKKHNKIKT